MANDYRFITRMKRELAEAVGSATNASGELITGWGTDSGNALTIKMYENAWLSNAIVQDDGVSRWAAVADVRHIRVDLGSSDPVSNTTIAVCMLVIPAGTVIPATLAEAKTNGWVWFQREYPAGVLVNVEVPGVTILQNSPDNTDIHFVFYRTQGSGAFNSPVSAQITYYDRSSKVIEL